jgi:pimeloyl-ACP methyl ester carboxylesterase
LAERLRTLETSDGRTLAFALWGDPDGFPVLGNHGCPGSRFDRWPDEALYTQLGIFLVTHDRAGYARSGRRRGRKVADEVDDLALLADHLGIGRFGVTGASGGGPHALACAARLPDRVVGAVASVCIAPIGEGGMEYDDWIDGMDPANVEFSKLEIAGDEQTLTEKLEGLRRHIAENIEADPRAGTEDFELGESDEAAAAIPELAQMAAESGVEWARGHVGGWVDDSLALARPWAFDLSQIKVPVLLRYGLADVFVPPGHGRWLASQIPGCEVVVEDEAGHYAQDPARTTAENLDWLRHRVDVPRKSE